MEADGAQARGGVCARACALGASTVPCDSALPCSLLAAPCRPCSDTEVLLAVCTSDFGECSWLPPRGRGEESHLGPEDLLVLVQNSRGAGETADDPGPVPLRPVQGCAPE